MIRSLPLTMKSLDMIRLFHFSNRKSETTLLSDQVLTVTLTRFGSLTVCCEIIAVSRPFKAGKAGTQVAHHNWVPRRSNI